ncbi:MAG: division/cell wall cluster transcriptional repressor MraZ [Spirochaetaceae bacterium]|nr:MAG: division/cell wall cluster transcriptional repressor MraZ [Spirochaetaceae bacterium]
MNTGEFHITLDDKGRLLVPARIRSQIRGNSLVVTRGIDRCLWLFSPDEWDSFSSRLLSASSPFSRRGRLMQRRIVAPAQEIELDKSGRLNIPKSLQESADLAGDTTLLVMERYMEIWDANAYRTYEAESEAELQEAAEELGGLVSFSEE